MPEKKKDTTELKDKELENVSGGGPHIGSCVKGYFHSGAHCADCGYAKHTPDGDLLCGFCGIAQY